MRDPFSILRDRESSEDDLWRAVDALGSVSEPASFWSAIANDLSRRADQRALALTEVVARHVVPGSTTVGEFAEMLDGAPWLETSDVDVVTAIGGKVPVTWAQDGTVAVLALPARRGAIYLSIAGSWRVDEIASALRGASPQSSIRSAVIRDAAVETRRLAGRTIVRRVR
jgi:hypothetical protein